MGKAEVIYHRWKVIIEVGTYNNCDVRALECTTEGAGRNPVRTRSSTTILLLLTLFWTYLMSTFYLRFLY